MWQVVIEAKTILYSGKQIKYLERGYWKDFFFEKSPTIARPYLYVVLGQILTRGKNYEALN